MTDNPAPVPSLASAEVNTAAAIGESVADGTTASPEPEQRVGKGYIVLIVLAQFGMFAALVAPIGYSLAVQMSRISPENQTALGYITGFGALVVVLLGPVVGLLSDRTRTRFGRRRPWLASLTIVGLGGLLVCALAPNFTVLLIGWLVVQFGIGVGGLQLTNSLADRVPDSQRGKVAGLTGVATLVASVFGTGIAAAFASDPVLLFMVPGLFGAVLIFLFIIFIKEPDARSEDPSPKTTPIEIVSSYGYNIAKYADFSWNWLGRFLFNFGLTLVTTFTTFFFAQKLGLPPAELGGIVALTGLLGVVATAGGAGFGGWISDKIGRRKMPVLISALLFTGGAVIMAFAPDLTFILIGGAIANLGLGVFSAVDQAIYLSVLPERETQAGRFVAINQFSTSIPQTLAPITASFLLLIGGTAADPNYFLLFLIGAGFALVGGNIILFLVKSVR
jgi:MFS family permease